MLELYIFSLSGAAELVEQPVVNFLSQKINAFIPPYLEGYMMPRESMIELTRLQCIRIPRRPRLLGPTEIYDLPLKLQEGPAHFSSTHS